LPPVLAESSSCNQWPVNGAPSLRPVLATLDGWKHIGSDDDAGARIRSAAAGELNREAVLQELTVRCLRLLRRHTPRWCLASPGKMLIAHRCEVTPHCCFPLTGIGALPCVMLVYSVTVRQTSSAASRPRHALLVRAPSRCRQPYPSCWRRPITHCGNATSCGAPVRSAPCPGTSSRATWSST
jgi:hypothetical protein